MFEQIGTVIIVIVVLVVGAGLGLFAGFVLGRHKGQEMARGVKSEELEGPRPRWRMRDSRTLSSVLAMLPRKLRLKA